LLGLVALRRPLCAILPLVPHLFPKDLLHMGQDHLLLWPVLLFSLLLALKAERKRMLSDGAAYKGDNAESGSARAAQQAP